MGRHRIHRSQARRSIAEVIGGLVLFVSLFGVSAGWWLARPVQGQLAVARSTPLHVSGVPASASATVDTLHRIYGHSLVPGGIHSIDELRMVMENDQLLAEHYKGFDLSKTQFITLDRDVVAYVSYRLGKGIYWSSRPTIISKGELVITDGSNFIRARCGNRISSIPGVTDPDEPSDTDLVVAVHPADLPNFPGSTPPLVGNGPNSPAPFIAGTSPSAPLSGANSGGAGPTPPAFPLCCFGGGTNGTNGPAVPSGPTTPTFTADEFSTISVSLLGHAGAIPSQLATLLAGILLMVALRFLIWR